MRVPRVPRRAGLVALALMILAPRPAIAAWPTDPTVNLPVCTAAQDQLVPASVSDDMGGAIIAWCDLRNSGMTTEIDIYAQHVLASGVVDPAWPVDGRALCIAEGQKGTPAIASDGAGGAIVTWPDWGCCGACTIYAQHILVSGAEDPAWPMRGRAMSTASAEDDPRIVSDGVGGAIVTWQDERSGNSDIYAQHVLASGVVDPAWPAGGRALCIAVNDQGDPWIVTDGAGGAIVAWQDGRSRNLDIYAQHVLAGGVVDPAWPADGRVVCAASGIQFSPRIVADGAGGAIVTWQDERSGNADIYAQHVLASGVVDPAWPADGRALCRAANDQNMYTTATTIASDGVGGAIVTWQDERSGNADIYAQHVLASGVVDPAWPGDGRALCSAAQDQSDPAILPDGSGGAIVTWCDYRSNTEPLSNLPNVDIYAQHVLASGVVDPAWPPDGRALCTDPHFQGEDVIVTDGEAGAVVTWSDHRNATDNGNGTNEDIYAQRVLFNGQLGGDFPTAVQVSLVSAEARDGTARLCWALSSDAPNTVTVYRSTATMPWQALRSVTSDGAGYVRYEDATVAAGTRYGYRLGLRAANGTETFAGETWVDLPASALDATVRVPNPVVNGDVTASFLAPVGRTVRVALLDVAGRVVATEQVAGAGTRQSVGLGRSDDLAPGVYLVRVELERPVVARVAVIR